MSTNMMTTRSSLGNNGLKQIKELHLLNTQKNDKIRKQQEEEDKRKKNEKEVEECTTEEEVSKEAEGITSQVLLEIMNGVESTETSVMQENSNEDEAEEQSPLKKHSGSSKSATRRKLSHPQVTPPEPETTASTASSNRTTFLNNFVYPYPPIILKLVITLKGNKAFEEFAQALMAFITNAQMVDPKFMINPPNPSLKEKSIGSKVEVSPNMTKLGTHIKISGNGNAFNKKKIWSSQENDCKSCKSNKEDFRDPTVYFSMVVSTEVRPQEIIDRVSHDWAHLNGSHLQVKDLQSARSETVVTFFKVSTATPKHVILAKLMRILLEAQKKVQDDLLNITTYDFMFDKGILDGASLPEIIFVCKMHNSEARKLRPLTN